MNYWCRVSDQNIPSPASQGPGTGRMEESWGETLPSHDPLSSPTKIHSKDRQSSQMNYSLDKVSNISRDSLVFLVLNLRIYGERRKAWQRLQPRIAARSNSQPSHWPGTWIVGLLLVNSVIRPQSLDRLKVATAFRFHSNIQASFHVYKYLFVIIDGQGIVCAEPASWH